MTEFDRLSMWFEEHYPGEQGWSIHASVSKDQGIRVSIQNYGRILVQYDAKTRPTDRLFERVEQAIQAALERLVEMSWGSKGYGLGRPPSPFKH